MESILCLIEMTQFQQKMRKYYVGRYGDIATESTANGLDSDLDKRPVSKQWWLMMPDIVPQSTIVYGNMDNMDPNDKCREFMERASKIYERYIEVESELEINIAWSTRQELTAIFDTSYDMEQWLNNLGDVDEKVKLEAIYALFVECMGELHYLLNSLFMRFKKSALFDKLCNPNGAKI